MKKYVMAGMMCALAGYGGQVRAMDSAGAVSCLSVACELRAKKKLMRAFRVGTSKAMRGDNCLTSLHCAAREGRIETALLLLERKAAPDAQSAYGYSCLHYAVLGNTLSGIVEVLLCSGADSRVQCKDGRTPLHIAAFFRKEEAVRSLLAHGANIDAQDLCGNTPLHDVAGQVQSDCADLVRFLLSCGANGNIKNNRGQTPQDLAFKKGNHAITRVFLDYKQKEEGLCVVS